MDLISLKDGSWATLGTFGDQNGNSIISGASSDYSQFILDTEFSLQPGDKVVVVGSAYNDGLYEVVSVNSSTITVTPAPPESYPGGRLYATKVPQTGPTGPDTVVIEYHDISDIPNGAYIQRIVGAGEGLESSCSTVNHASVHIAAYIAGGSDYAQLTVPGDGKIDFCGPSSSNNGRCTAAVVEFSGAGSYNDEYGQVEGVAVFTGVNSTNNGTLSGSHHEFRAEGNYGGQVSGDIWAYANVSASSTAQWNTVIAMVAGIAVSNQNGGTISGDFQTSPLIAPDPANVRRGVPYNQTVGAMPASVLRLIPN